MSLMIGCILIYHYQMDWWWYLWAAAMYYAEWQMHHRYYSNLWHKIHDPRLEYRVNPLKE